MRINIPKVVLPVQLSEYAPALSGKVLHVWVNPPREKLSQYDELVADLQRKELASAKELFTETRDETPPAKDGILARLYGQVEALLHKQRQKAPVGIDTLLLQWYADIWSQGPEDERWTVDELRDLEAQDPAFLNWMIYETWKIRSEHAQLKKKV